MWTASGRRGAAAGWFPRRYRAVPASTRTFVEYLSRAVRRHVNGTACVPHVCLTIPGRREPCDVRLIWHVSLSFLMKLPCFLFSILSELRTFSINYSSLSLLSKYLCFSDWRCQVITKIHLCLTKMKENFHSTLFLVIGF